MRDYEEFWNDLKSQIEIAHSQIKIYQQQRFFLIEVLYAVLFLGFFINILSSIVYDSVISKQFTFHTFLGVCIILLAILASFLYLQKTVKKYSPLTPRIRFDIEPMIEIDEFDRTWLQATEILDRYQKNSSEQMAIIQELWNSIKNSLLERPPFKHHSEIIQEIFDDRYMILKFTNEYRNIKHEIEIQYVMKNIIDPNPIIFISIKILEPSKPNADEIWNESTIVYLIMDITYIVETGVKRFNETHTNQT
jgi:hypothetical protein